MASVLGKKIPKMLAHEALSLEQVAELYKFLEGHARGMEEIRAEMERDDLPESYYQVAEDLGFIFTDPRGHGSGAAPRHACGTI